MIFHNVKEPFENITTNAFIATVAGRSNSGKSFMTKALIDSIIPVTGKVVIGADKEKSEVYKDLDAVFIPELDDDIFDKVKEIYETKFRSYDYLLFIADDITGLLTKTLKKKFVQWITTARHYNVFQIYQIHTLKSTVLPKELRANSSIIATYSRGIEDIETFEHIAKSSGIKKVAFDEALTVAHSIKYSFLVWSSFNEFLVVFGEGGFV
jgi:ABC-type oligopeptide transport system ATPase subunit